MKQKQRRWTPLVTRISFGAVKLMATVIMAACLSGCLGLMSRKGWNDPGDARFISERSFEPKELAWLKSTTTIFFLRPEDLPRRAAFEEAVARAWHLTPIKVVPIDERSQYADRTRYSYFVIGGDGGVIHPFGENADISHVSMSVHHYYLTLVHAGPGPDLVTDATVYCRIELHLEFISVGELGLTSRKDELGAFYKLARFRNWTPGQIELYLASAQRDLEGGRRRWLYEDYEDKAELERLKAATLLIPDYVLVKFNKWSGDESERHDPAKLFDEYHHPYRVVSPQELSDVMASAKGPVYVLDYVRSSSDKFVSIFERRLGMIYRHYRSSSYNFDDDDLDIY